MPKIFSKIMGRMIATRLAKTTLDAVMRARDRRWNWLGHIRRLEQHGVIRKVIFELRRTNPDSLFGDAPDLYLKKTAEIS